MIIIWLEFLICLGAIAFAGSSLSRYGDVIAEKTGVSGTWVGIVMLGGTGLFYLTTLFS